MLTVLFAQPPQQQQEVPFFLHPFFLITMMILFWVVIVLPMSRRQKQDQAKMLASIARGAKVLTSGGIIGTVVTAKDGEDEITIRSDDTKLKISRGYVVRVLGNEDAEPGK